MTLRLRRLCLQHQKQVTPAFLAASLPMPIHMCSHGLWQDIAAIQGWDVLCYQRPVAALELTAEIVPGRGEETEEEKAENIKGICVGESHGV